MGRCSIGYVGSEMANYGLVPIYPLVFDLPPNDVLGTRNGCVDLLAASAVLPVTFERKTCQSRKNFYFLFFIFIFIFTFFW